MLKNLTYLGLTVFVAGLVATGFLLTDNKITVLEQEVSMLDRTFGAPARFIATPATTSSAHFSFTVGTTTPLTQFGSTTLAIYGSTTIQTPINTLHAFEIFDAASTSAFRIDTTSKTASTTALVISGISGSTQCLQIDTDGDVTGFGSGCGGTGAAFAWTTETLNGQLGNSTSTLLRLFGGASTTAFSANTLSVGQTATSSFNSAGALTLASALAITSGGTGATVLDDILGTANQLTVTNGADTIIGGDATLSLPNLVIFPVAASSTRLSVFDTAYFGGTATTTISSAGVTIPTTGTFTVVDLTSALLLTGAGGLFAEYTGTSCTNQFVRSLDALGAATCATVGAGDVSLANLTATDASLTFSGTYNGSTARTIGLNVGNANTWTALQTINHASTTNLSIATWLSIPSGTAPAMTTVGQVALDTTENELLIATSTVAGAPAVIKPYEWKGFSHASSSQGTGSTTKPFFIAPPNGAGYFDSITCTATSSTANLAFLRVMLSDEAGNRMNDLVASTTENNIKFTVNNAFTAGEVISAQIGTTTNIGVFAGVTCFTKIIWTRN